MRGWLIVLVGGAALGASSAWHAHIGGAGTTGRGWPVVALAVIAVAGVVAALLGGS